MERVADALPIVDVRALVEPGHDRREVARRISAACREDGFFYAVGHGVDESLQRALVDASRRFFARPLEEKLTIAMARGGRAWRGYFPLGGELTSGVPDRKEGLYFGAELATSHPLVAAATPLHGPNLFPADMPELRDAVLAYLAAMSRLGHALLRGVALALALDEEFFAERYTDDPLTLFRVFHYPAASGEEAGWGVGEHTDYGFLTILKQDDAGGLEVRTRARGWIAAPPVPGSFVCNIGDMLDRLTGGRFRSTPHRVRSHPSHDRLSFPFFFDPGWHAEIRAIGALAVAPRDDAATRWDGASPHELDGSYGAYLLGKVARVFPELARRALQDAGSPS